MTGASACGSSSSSSSSESATTSAAVTSTAATVATTTVAATLNPAVVAAYRAKLNAYASCMTRNGVQVPPATTGPNGIPSVGTPQQVPHQQLFAALHKCRKLVVAALNARHSITAP
jgi:hypothetical protein